MRRKSPGFGQLCLASPVCVSECSAKSLPQCQPVLGWLTPCPRWVLSTQVCLPWSCLCFFQGRGEGSTMSCAIYSWCANQAAVRKLPSTCQRRPALVTWTYSVCFCWLFGKVSVVVLQNTKEWLQQKIITFCQEALSVVLCVSWYPKWQPFVAAWLEIRRVLGFQIKCERALFLHLPCTECCSWSQEGWACLMTELENGRVQEEKVTWNKAWLDITDIFSHSSNASRHDHNFK